MTAEFMLVIPRPVQFFLPRFTKSDVLRKLEVKEDLFIRFKFKNRHGTVRTFILTNRNHGSYGTLR